MDGLAMCETLRRNPDTASVPVVMVSALTSQLTRFAGLEAGAVEFVTKPFSIRDLMSCVKRILRAGGMHFARQV